MVRLDAIEHPAMKRRRAAPRRPKAKRCRMFRGIKPPQAPVTHQGLLEETVAALSPASFWSPEHVCRSAWLEHVPFAFWLCGALRPRRFVELGTGHGYSYFAFCQAIERLATGTAAYAIDLWAGEDDAGFHGDDVFQAVATRNRERYAAFSELIRSSFENALRSFEDRSIDLLHFNGHHRYDAIRSDFESWRPKLAENAVVLFPNTNVREGDFGVWRFFEELAAVHPSFRFLHGNGLGLIALGHRPPAPLLSLLGAPTEAVDQIRAAYAVLGGALVLRRALAAKGAAIAAALAEGTDTSDANAEALARIGDWDSQVEEVRTALHARDLRLSELRAVLGEREARLGELQEHCRGLEAALADGGCEVESLRELTVEAAILAKRQDEALAERDRVIQALRAGLASQASHRALQDQRYHEVAQRLDAIEASTSWKITRSLRAAMDDRPALRTAGRQVAKVLWWMTTGQIRQRLRARSAGSHPAPPLAPEPDPLPPAPVAPPSPAIPEAARRIEDDHSLALPLRFPSRTRETAPRIAAVVHLFYEELAHEFRLYFEGVPLHIDLFISTADAFRKSMVEAAFEGWTHGRMEVRVVANRGRNIAPMLVGFRDVYDRYEYVLHLDSKRSNHPALAAWRHFLLENLLGTGETVASILDLFERNPRVGIVASQHFEPVRHWIDWGGNFSVAQDLARRMGFTLDESKALDFPSGSMFWARSAALRPLLDLGLATEDFEEEAGQVDGTLAHAIEHLYFHACEHAGYDWIKVARPELFAHTPAIVSAETPEELDRFFDRFMLRLLGPDGPTPRVTRPAPVAQPAPRLLDAVRRRALGSATKISLRTHVVVGLVTHHTEAGTDARALRLAVGAARLALERAGLATQRRVLVLDNCADTSPATAGEAAVARLPSGGNIGFGAGHNRLMRFAFQAGADLYIVANPDGALHPDAVTALVQMAVANEGRALIEALQFPVEHPKTYDPTTFETPWVSGACVAVPRVAFEALNGFDESFFMYCEDVDLSWRARALGFALRTCPRALFLHAWMNRQRSPATLRMMLESGIILARKWGAPEFENRLRGELEALSCPPPSMEPDPVPADWRRYADFNHHFTFARPRL
jgi:rhamnan synthesis protein F/methyltransferase family protein